jgi:hypothetical protein
MRSMCMIVHLSAQVVSHLEGLIASESSRTSRMVVNSSERYQMPIFKHFSL